MRKTTLGERSHNRLLKILHIDPERNWGGGEAQVLGLLTYLCQKGHRNDLLTHPGGRLFEQTAPLGVKRLSLVARNDLDLRPVPALRRLIRSEKYDIVHFHTKRAHSLSLWLPRGPQCPKYVVTRRMDYPETKSWYTRYLYNRRVDGVVAISRVILELLVDAGVEAGRIRLIHSGIDPERFVRCAAAEAVTEGEAVVGIVAALELRKGHRYLLEAAARLKGRGHRIRYLIAGDGPARRELDERVKALSLVDEVRFCGFVSDAPAFLSQIDIFVLPSLYEGLGVAVLEAMAAGKPVIASRVGGLPELVADGETGLLVAPKNVEGLVAAIARLADDKSLAREMGRKGAARARASFSLENMAAQNEAYYYELIGAPVQS
ncbi:MAG: glycosyltransferase family 4 protein [Deltaproteobacteria bacterium]|nr:glycosyltransferase family 4 protein [Deltaproteobacteria bacterium]MDZ4343591.1 glycosyltransferase family 4 protein [Candidatus Binatia bacterium]